MDRGNYLGGWPTTVEVNGRQLEVTAHFAIVGGRMTCVGLDVRSFWSPIGFRPPEDKEQIFPVGLEWTEITSPLLRGVRTAEVIESAYETSGSAIRSVLDSVVGSLKEAGVPDGVADQMGPQLDALITKDIPGRRRGRKPLLDDDVLRDVVAKTYQEAPRKPVQAVREALAAAVPAYKGAVSPDVARKAVATARARGFIPPANSGRQRQEGRS
jgi:hypothetical protein